MDSDWASAVVISSLKLLCDAAGIKKPSEGMLGADGFWARAGGTQDDATQTTANIKLLCAAAGVKKPSKGVYRWVGKFGSKWNNPISMGSPCPTPPCTPASTFGPSICSSF